MALKPTHVASSSPRTQDFVAPQVGGINLEGLARGLDVYGKGKAIEKKQAATLLKQQNQKRDSLWVTKQTLLAQKEITTMLGEADMSPSATQVADFDDAWPAIADKYMKDAPSDDAADSLSIQLGGVEVKTLPKLIALEGRAKGIEAQRDLSEVAGMMEDLMANNPDPIALTSLEGLFKQDVDEITGSLISTETAEKFKEQTTSMRLNAIDVWAAQGHIQEARKALKETEGISGSVRAAKLNTLNRLEKQGNQIDNSLLIRDHEASISSIRETGQPTDSYDSEELVASYPSKDQVGKRTQINDDIAVAEGYYAFGQAINGISPAQIDEELMKLKPEAGTDAHHRKQRLYEEASVLANQRKQLIENDPFTAANQSPAVKQLLLEYTALDDADPSKDLLQQDLVTANISVQMEMGVPQNAIKVSSTDQLASYAKEINEGSVDNVVTRISQLRSIYGEYYPDLFRNMVELPKDQQVSTELSMIHEHLLPNEKGNVAPPPWVYNFVDASRTSIKDLGFSDKDYNEFKDLTNTGSFLQLRQAMLGAGGNVAFERSQEVREALIRFAMHKSSLDDGSSYRKAMQSSMEQVVGSMYEFRSAKGTPYGIPRKIDGIITTPEFADKVEFALATTLKESEQKEFGKTVSDERGLGQRTKVPFTIDQVSWKQFGFTGDESGDYKAKIVSDSVATHGYWATNVDGNGVVLMSKDIGGRTAVPLLNDDGETIEVTFNDAAAWAEEIANIRKAEREQRYRTIQERR
jgi:hypothetical protein